MVNLLDQTGGEVTWSPATPKHGIVTLPAGLELTFRRSVRVAMANYPVLR